MDLGNYDPEAQAMHFHRDNHARAMALLRAYRTDEGDVTGWHALVSDLMPPLPPEGHPLYGQFSEQRRRIHATLLAFADLSSRLLDQAHPDPDEWLLDQHEQLLRGLRDEP